ncbi:MAG: hypothetical protein ACRD9R_05760 [Pyrinomonadaceae bacterium]
MRTHHFIHHICGCALVLLALSFNCFAQTAEQETATSPAARDAELLCAGFIAYLPSPNYLEVVGGEQEQEQRTYAEGDFVFINAGSDQGVRLGNEYVAVRPRGQFKSKLSKKDGWLGVYTQEIGRLRVTEVKQNVSVAVVANSCDMILNGDLLRAVYPRVSPPSQTADELDRFADSSGKQQGRIVLARDGREMMTVNHIVYIDLGTEDNVKPGDRLTVFRPAGRGNISRFKDEEVSPAANYGFESEIFRGGKFSNKVQRIKSNKMGIFGPTVSTPDVVSRRPPVPRKVVGEIVILSTEQRTATAIITRIAQEVHTGDFVEVK